jgi:hypothetical protein
MTLAKLNTIAAPYTSINGVAYASIAGFNGIAVPSAVTDAHTLIATATASASATLSFTSGIDSTYDAYEFRFENMHPATDAVNFTFQVNAVGQTGFNEVMTTTVFQAYHNETGTDTTALQYVAGYDQAQGTAYQVLTNTAGFDNDQSVSGVLTLYAPSSTTYVKHFVTRLNCSHPSDYSVDLYAAGYINTTAAIDEISFKMSSGNIDAGQIKMYGIAKA